MEGRFFEDVVRLHVIADSDEDEAQRVKMCVVNAIRRKAARIAGRAVNAREAFARLTRASGTLTHAARNEARRQRFPGPVKVETGVFPFPDRRYGEALMPAGDYRAVRVVMGAGAGRNWWCVVYPNLCAVEEACAQALASSEAVTFYSSVGRFLQDLIKGVGL